MRTFDLSLSLHKVDKSIWTYASLYSQLKSNYDTHQAIVCLIILQGLCHTKYITKHYSVHEPLIHPTHTPQHQNPRKSILLDSSIQTTLATYPTKSHHIHVLIGSNNNLETSHAKISTAPSNPIPSKKANQSEPNHKSTLTPSKTINNLPVSLPPQKQRAYQSKP